MSNTKHTPGPWNVAERQSYFGIYAKPPKPGNKGQIAACTKPIECAEANARLMAAAPDMLDALKALVDPDNSSLFFAPDAWAHKILDDVRAAITKAEGTIP